MITLDFIYALAGLMFAAFAVLAVFDRENPRRPGNALFWSLLSASFLGGSYLSDFANGVLVIAMVLVGGLNFMRTGVRAAGNSEERARRALARGNWLFAPPLLIPIFAVAGTLFFKDISLVGRPLLDAHQVTLISVAIGILVALLAATVWLRPPPLASLKEGLRLADTIGWAAILPQMLASLGAVFATAGMGSVVGEVTTQYIPLDNRAIAVGLYCAGMAGFTAIMGNAFAAFPVMTAAIGLPVIVERFHGNVAIMGAIGMLAGFCGTLTTPMAANFNIVPAALLELKDRHGVIRVQIPTAVPLLIANMILMYFCVFRF